MPPIDHHFNSGYPEELVQNAKEYGYKAANLDYLDKIVAQYYSQKYSAEYIDFGTVQFEVPKHIGIASHDIEAHLNKYAPKWKSKWDEFVKIQSGAKDLSQEALGILKEIRTEINQAFAEHKFPLELEKNERFMVRSTGEEDRVDVANPGGNESVPSDSESMDSSIGTVVASYFSEKSMSQRLKSDENIVAKPPLMACLIQKLVGESQGKNVPPVSGVIYTDDNNVRIQAAPGHGELIVNSKGNFDNFFVTKENVVHQYIAEKKFRLTPEFDPALKKISLAEVENERNVKDNSSLNEQAAVELANFAKFAQEKYGMRMDLEFVLDPNSNTISIVQARPIPLGKRAGLTPSALSDNFIATQKPQAIEGQVITPEVMSAKVIKHKEEILICDNMEEALKTYLKNKDNQIKAIIVNKPSPDTSHEAGFFSSQGLPVIQADDFEQAKSWSNDLETKVLVIDPQHASVYKLEQTEFQDDLIKEGVFRSTLSGLVTPIEREFMQGPARENPKRETKLIGDLIKEAKENPEATQKLFRFFEEIGVEEKENYNQKDLKPELKALQQVPISKEDFESHSEAIARVIGFVNNIKNEKKIASTTYEQLVINGIELYKVLKELELNPEDQQTRIHYLNIHKKFEGIIESKDKKEIFSTSVVKEIQTHEKKILLKQEVVQDGFDLSKINEESFLNLAQHKEYLFDEKNQQKWLDFCYETCQKDEDAKLNTLVDNIAKLDLKEYWLNVNFLNTYDKDKENSLSHLQNDYQQNLAASRDALKAVKMIDRLENQIKQWNDPNKFDELFNNELKPKIAEINQLLKVDETNKLAGSLAIKQLYRLVDVFDLSIKQVQNSYLYENKEEQVDNFRNMLGEFLGLMEKHINIYPKKLENIEDRMGDIKEFMYDKLTSKESDELFPSENFSVIKADLLQDNDMGFFRGFTNVKDKTLADLHTLIHQAFITSISKQSTNVNKDLMKALPEFVKGINNNILDPKLNKFKNYNINYIGSGFDDSRKEIIYCDATHPYVNLYYKIPLRHHSGILKSTYNIHNKDIKLDYTLFGYNVQGLLAAGRMGDLNFELGRWIELEKYGFLMLETLTEVKLIDHKADEHMINLQLLINQETINLKKILTILNLISDATLDGTAELAKAFQDNGVLTKILAEQGFSKLIITSCENAQGKLDFEEFFDIKHALKNSTEHTQKQQEMIALLRFMSWDDTGNIDRNKLKILKEEFQSNELDFAELVIKNINRFSPNVLPKLTNSLASYANKNNVLEISNIIYNNSESIPLGLRKHLIFTLLELNDVEVSSYIIKFVENINEEPYLTKVAQKLLSTKQKIAAQVTSESEFTTILVKELILSNRVDEALEITKKITNDSMLEIVVEALINKYHIKEALEITQKITNDSMLEIVVEALINKDHIKEALEITQKITNDNILERVAEALINKDHIKEALEITQKITNDNMVERVVEALINKDHIKETLEISQKITDNNILEKMAIKLIDKNKIDEVIKVTKKITSEISLAKIAKSFIRKKLINEGINIAEKIRYDENALETIARQFIFANHIDKTMEIVEKIKDEDILVRMAGTLLAHDHFNEAIKVVEKITSPLYQEEGLNKLVAFAKKDDNPEIFIAISNLAIRQGQEEYFNILLPSATSSNILNSFKDQFKSPTAEAITPPFSNSEKHERPMPPIQQNNINKRTLPNFVIDNNFIGNSAAKNHSNGSNNLGNTIVEPSFSNPFAPDQINNNIKMLLSAYVLVMQAIGRGDDVKWIQPILNDNKVEVIKGPKIPEKNPYDYSEKLSPDVKTLETQAAEELKEFKQRIENKTLTLSYYNEFRKSYEDKVKLIAALKDFAEGQKKSFISISTDSTHAQDPTNKQKSSKSR